MLPVHELEELQWRPLLFNGLDGLEELIALAKAEAGNLTLLACHMLRQDSKQACFSWHQDNLNNPHTKLSMVFLLSERSSSMRVAGFVPFVYDGPGYGCAFPSGAHHRSGGSSRHVEDHLLLRLWRECGGPPHRTKGAWRVVTDGR